MVFECYGDVMGGTGGICGCVEYCVDESCERERGKDLGGNICFIQKI